MYTQGYPGYWNNVTFDEPFLAPSSLMSTATAGNIVYTNTNGVTCVFVANTVGLVPIAGAVKVLTNATIDGQFYSTTIPEADLQYGWSTPR